MNHENLFEQDWRDCLRAHYVHVISERDVVNEDSLISVLRQTGFSDDEISAIHAETFAALGWDTQPEQIEDSDAEIAEEAPAEVVDPVPSSAAAEPAPQDNEPAPVETVQPVAQSEPDEPDELDEPPEPDNFVQMSLF